MPFTLPNLHNTLTACKDLTEHYQADRKKKDDNRIFSSLRAATHNEDRINDTKFIEKFANTISALKFRYQHEIDPSLTTKKYATEVAPILRKAMSGALLFELQKINETYYSEGRVKNSALATIILNRFCVDTYSEIDPEIVRECLFCFKDVLTKFQNKALPEELQIKWHETMTNEELMQKIDAAFPAREALVTPDEEMCAASSSCS